MNYISNLPAICAGGGLATNGSDQKGDLAWKEIKQHFEF